MTYRIEGAQGVVLRTDSAAEALTKARAASRQFGPIKIFGPGGEITMVELKAAAKAEEDS